MWNAGIGWVVLATVAAVPTSTKSPLQFPSVSSSGRLVVAAEQRPNKPVASGKDTGVVVVPGAPQAIDINRPRSPFDCELPIGQQWYGSRERCLAYLCGGENVYNEYIFDADGRRRKNPCYGQSPTELPPE
jgi:hypothetical protein